MAWGTAQVSTALTLTGSYATVQQSAADMEITLNPGETVQMLFDFNPQATPTEDCDIRVQRSHDGTTFESDGEAERIWIERANLESDDPAIRSRSFRDCHTLRVRARVRDEDDTAGGGDTGSTLTVRYRLDGVSI